MANITFDDLIPKQSGVVTFDDLIPVKGDDSGAFASGVQGFNSAVPFGNRLTATLAAAANYPLAKLSGSDLTYSDLYDTARANQKATEEAHPTANNVGLGLGLVNSLPIALTTGGANTAPVVGDIANAIQKANATAGNFVRGSALAPDAGLLARAGKTLSTGARSAAISAPTGFAYGYGAGDEGDRLSAGLQGAGMAAAVGSSVPIAAAALGGVSDKVGGVYTRLASLLGSQKAQGKIADNILAKRLVSEGFSPEEVSQAITDAKASGLMPTLGEATGSSGVQQIEKSVMRGDGAGANTMRDALFERNRNTVPTALQDFAGNLKATAGDVDSLYKAAIEEGDANLAKLPVSNKPIYKTSSIVDEAGNPQIIQAGVTKDAPLSELSNSLQSSIKNRLSQLGDVNNLETRALKQAKTIVDNAQNRGNSFEALVDAKRQLRDLYIEGADTVAQKNASNYVKGYAKQIDNKLKEFAPNTMPFADKMAQTRMAANDILDAVNSTNEGSLATLYNKVWAKPELQQDFLRKLPDDATRQQATNLFSHLEKIKRGFGGSDTAFNLPANQQLANEAGIGFNPNFASPIDSPKTLLSKIGGVAQPQVYKQIAKQSINPDAERLLKAMERVSGVPLISNGAPFGAGAAILDNEGKQSKTLRVNIPTNENLQNYNATPEPQIELPQISPQSNAVPAQNDDLFARVIQQESGGNQKAVSKRGAIGVAQIIPATAKEAAADAGLPYDAFKFRTDPQYNAALGKAYLGKLQNKYNNDALALMAYNWGQGNVDLWLKSGAKVEKIPSETVKYLNNILG